MYDYVQSVGEVQDQRDVSLPSWEEYIENRIYSVGGYPCLMAME